MTEKMNIKQEKICYTNELIYLSLFQNYFYKNTNVSRLKIYYTYIFELQQIVLVALPHKSKHYNIVFPLNSVGLHCNRSWQTHVCIWQRFSMKKIFDVIVPSTQMHKTNYSKNIITL